MALIAACTLEPGVYLSMNVKGDPAVTAATVTSLGFPVTVNHMQDLASNLGEDTLFGRTGGAATLAVGMAQIFSKAVSGKWLDLWYHFAIMFEALFILTTLDAGTRVGRYLLQDVLGHVWKPLADTKNLQANVLASVLVVTGWGYFLIQGVLDEYGGINSLWPLFGIANQMLAAIALCLATTVILKMQLATGEGQKARPGFGKPGFALITLLPLLWLLTVTMTAGVQKIFHSNPRIGFLAQARSLNEKWPALEQALAGAKATGLRAAIEAAEKAVHANRMGHFNNLLDAVIAGVFLVLLTAIVLLSFWEWILLLARRKLAVLREAEPVWLPDYALAETKPIQVMGLLGLGIALAKELSGEAQLERAAVAATLCQHEHAPDNGAGNKCAQAVRSEAYVKMTEDRFNGIRRCC